MLQILLAEQRKILQKTILSIQVKQKHSGLTFLLKEWLVGAVFLVGYLVLTVAHPSPLERPADPADTGYIPVPDWYFLFLYQLLKYEFASGPYNIIGAMVMPGLAFGALLLVPFLDTSKERRPSKRPLPTGFMLLALAAIIFLTWESVAKP